MSRENFGYGLNQRETTLKCNAVSFAEPMPRMIPNVALIIYCQLHFYLNWAGLGDKL